MDDFIEDFYAVDGFADTDYFGSLKRYGVDTESGIDSCDVDHADLELMRACITWCVRGDRFYDGCLRTYVECGFIDRCLLRLRSLTRAGRRSGELRVRLLRTVCSPAGCPGTTRDGAGNPGNASADAPERRTLEPLRGRDAGAGRAVMVEVQQAARERRQLAEPVA